MIYRLGQQGRLGEKSHVLEVPGLIGSKGPNKAVIVRPCTWQSAGMTWFGALSPSTRCSGRSAGRVVRIERPHRIARVAEAVRVVRSEWTAAVTARAIQVRRRRYTGAGRALAAGRDVARRFFVMSPRPAPLSGIEAEPAWTTRPAQVPGDGLPALSTMANPGPGVPGVSSRAHPRGWQAGKLACHVSAGRTRTQGRAGGSWR